MIFQRGVTEGTPSGDRRLYMVYTAAVHTLVYERSQSYYRGMKVHFN